MIPMPADAFARIAVTFLFDAVVDDEDAVLALYLNAPTV